MISKDHQLLAERGENIAEEYFRQKKYKVLARNYRCALGEIDLVLQKKRTLIFVEVKTRSSLAFGAPEEAVNQHKKRKLYQVAQCYLKEAGGHEEEIQFDVLSIIISPEGNTAGVSHFEKAIEF